jgi:hypothetical protein
MVREDNEDFVHSRESYIVPVNDKAVVEKIGIRLKDRHGLKVWLDKWNLVAGDPWQEAIEDALERSNCCAVFMGLSGIGPWQNEEMRSLVHLGGSSYDFPGWYFHLKGLAMVRL